MNPYSFISFITSIVVLFWGAFVFSKDTKDSSTRLFLIFSVITAYEATFEYLYITSASISDATMWIKFHLLGWPIAYLVQIHFILRYAGFKVKKLNQLFYALYSFTFLIVVYLSFYSVFTEIVNTTNGWIRLPTKIHTIQEGIFAVLLALLTFVLTIVGVMYRLRAKGKIEKLRANLLLAGILIPTWLPFLKNGIFPAISKISILFPDSPFIFIGWIFIVIAILYFKMFDITPISAADGILSVMNEALVLTNMSGKVTWANKRFFELFELEDTDIESEKIDFLNRINTDAIKFIGNRYQNEELKNLVIPINTYNKNQLYIGVSSTLLKNELNQIIGTVTILNDLTELINAQQELKNQQKQMLEMAHQAGMSEVTTSVMHNVGNILNSVNISSEIINMILTNSKLPGLLKANELLFNYRNNLTDFFTKNQKGKILPEYYEKLGLELTNEQNKLKSESQNLFDKIKLIKDAIDIQQDYSFVRNLNEPIILNTMIDEIINIMEESFKKNNVVIHKKFIPNTEFQLIAPASKLLNVILNVIKNAYESVKLNTQQEKLITIKVSYQKPNFVQISITDNGIGIEEEVMSNIFKFGFTTKHTGHGYGLHFCANVLNEMNGSISANSEGEGKGAEFIITIPKEQNSEAK